MIITDSILSITCMLGSIFCNPIIKYLLSKQSKENSLTILSLRTPFHSNMFVKHFLKIHNNY